jgi:hypothetical protein
VAGTPAPQHTFSRVSGLVWSTTIGAGGTTSQLQLSCPSSGLAMGAGYVISGGSAYPLDLYPLSDSAWAMYVYNPGAAATYTITMYLTCETPG